jgi:hypothetical protein
MNFVSTPSILYFNDPSRKKCQLKANVSLARKKAPN